MSLSPARLALALLALLTAHVAAAQTPPLDVRVFADVPEPGMPEGIAISPFDGTVYAGSSRRVGDTAPRPSLVFVYDANGLLVDQWTIQGQNPTNSGVLGMALDGEGVLYVLDRDPPRVLRIEPSSGAQATYATFHDVPNCTTPWTPGDDCGADLDDSAPTPNYPVFAADGTLYVTDSAQGLIWRVPPGGGAGSVWFSDAALDGVFGPNGIQFRADGTTLLFALTGYQGPDLGFATGRLYELPVLPGGAPGALSLFWQSQPVDGPDGFSIAASGNVYVALAGTNQLVVVGSDENGEGFDLARVPATPADNALLDPPMDMPASTGFLGSRLLMTNQSLFTGNPNSWVIYDIGAEPGLPLAYPLPEPGALAGTAGVLLLSLLRRRRA